ncbi:peptidase domain-containing ABC transporter [Bradyrhizobium sp.]|jgi:ATP-binding cassette subfamily B protein RaxB|uniref:peptidase domain-containing ABC transporter n=1 Tax=Bradyrhizobium sp. TaxID=376 RepID=UPI002E04124C|nr:peptidase domain-containing ABC transporter [Bradyrhizobium sp.]
MNILERLNLGWGSRLPMVLQTEASECGLACLVMVTQYFGNAADLPGLRRRFGMSLKGATLKDVMRVAEQVGFAARPLRLELDELAQLRTPSILHWDLNHFVVLERIDGDSAVIHDPAVGVRRMPMAEISRHFTGVALELMPTSKFETAEPPPRVKVSQLLGRVNGLRRSLLHLSGLALTIEIFAMLSPFFLGWVIDQALVSGDRDLLLTLAIGFALLLLLRTAVTALRGWMLMGMNASLKVQSRANLFSHLIHLPTSYFEARHIGDVMSRFGSQETILQAITSELVEAILDGTMAAVTLLIMFVFAPDLACVVLFGAVLYGGLRWASYRPLRHATSEAIVWGARRDSHFLETLRGMRTVKLFNGQDDRKVHWLNLLVETINRQLTADKLRLLFRTASQLLFGLLGIIVIWLGARRVLDGSFSAGLLIAFLAYKDQFLDRIGELINKAVDLTMLRLHAERLADIALTEPETRQSGHYPADTEYLPARIEVRNLGFRYSEHEPWIFENVSFRIEAGESVAIVGPSGGGKTTLLKVMAGLLQPAKGEILINGEPIKRIGLEAYRNMLGVVLQDDQLFAGSISENISFFSDAPDQGRIEACAILASVHDDIVAMPMGFGTLIGDMGTVLSGGQKQRVLIARALYRRPGVLLLDEATSHLDVKREREVNEALRYVRATRVVIAHRPETIRAADRVIAIGAEDAENLPIGREANVPRLAPVD